MIKADGYGLGARQVAAALHAAGCRHFFVAYLNEALAVRDVVPGAMLAVLSGLIPGTEDAYVAHDLTPVLGSLDEIDALAGRSGRDAILHVDTGMSRLGLDARELAVLARDQHPAGRHADPLCDVASGRVGSAGRSAEPAAARALRARPGRCCRRRRAAWRTPPAFSSAPDFASDLARPGAALYGINPTPGQPNPMRACVRLSVRVLAVREIPAGATVGYNATWIAARPSRIATAALGYADGFHRSLSGRGSACFDGTPVPLVGRVSMDLTTFDVTDHPAVQPGCWLEVLGPHLSPDDVAAAAGTNGYEVLTSLGRRFHRVYRTA